MYDVGFDKVASQVTGQICHRMNGFRATPRERMRGAPTSEHEENQSKSHRQHRQNHGRIAQGWTLSTDRLKYQCPMYIDANGIKP